MRKLGVRVVSAALAACMMASALPVGAFAAGTGYDEDVSTYADTGDTAARELPDTVTEGGTYTMSGPHWYTVTINAPDQDVTIDIEESTELWGGNTLFWVRAVRDLTINGNNFKVDGRTGGLLWAVKNNGSSATPAVTGTLKVKNVVYEGERGIQISDMGNGASVELKNVQIETSGKSTVINSSSGTVAIEDGRYECTSTDSNNVVLLNNNTGSIVITGNPEVHGQNTAVYNKAGTVTIDGGNYTSQNSFVVNNSVRGGTLNINGGTFKRETGDGKTINNSGTMTIGADGTKTTAIEIKGVNAEAGAVINSGTLTVNRGTITAPEGTGIMAVNAAATTINGGTIENCNAGLGMQSGSGKLTVNNVILTGNTHDISLREGQKITFDSGYTDSPSIRVFDPTNGRQLTDGAPSGLSPESHNPGYSVKYENGEYYLHQNSLHVLNYESAAAKADDGSEDLKDLTSGAEVAAGTKVYLTADPAPESESGKEQVFDKWVVKNADGEVIEDLTGILEETESGKASLTMPDYEITVSATYKDKPAEPPVDPGDDTPDGGVSGGNVGDTVGGAIAAVVVGGAAAWGVYEAGTGIYRMMYMPGIILPTTRAELAMRVWEKADKPEPESDVQFEDIDEDDTDLQKAARWMVEQELMDEKDDNKFEPEGHVTKLRVCTTWNEAREKGLID